MVMRRARSFCLGVSLSIALVGRVDAMAPRPVPPPVSMEFVRAAYEPEAAAIAIEWIVPHVENVGPLDRLELMILNDKGAAVFGALQNLSDRCDPVPPGAFGVVLDPAIEDRSIKNVASTGQNGRWDQEAPGGTLLKQSVSGVSGGNLGIAFWIAPKDWKPDRYLIAVRAVRKNSRPEPWRHLATCDIPREVAGTSAARRREVKPLFRDAGNGGPMPAEHIDAVTLIRYEKRPQDKGVVVKRWAGDTSGDFKYVEIDKRTLKPREFLGGCLQLEPGHYQFKHNSVSGQPPSGFYGQSEIFEVRPGPGPMEVQINLNAAL